MQLFSHNTKKKNLNKSFVCLEIKDSFETDNFTLGSIFEKLRGGYLNTSLLLKFNNIVVEFSILIVQ